MGGLVHFTGSWSVIQRRFKAVRTTCPNIAESGGLLRPDRPPTETHFVEATPGLYHRSNTWIKGDLDWASPLALARESPRILILPVRPALSQHELVNLDNLEFSYHDETLSKMGLSPSEIDLVIPRFVKCDRAEEIEYWKVQMTKAAGKLELSELEVRRTSQWKY